MNRYRKKELHQRYFLRLLKFQIILFLKFDTLHKQIYLNKEFNQEFVYIAKYASKHRCNMHFTASTSWVKSDSYSFFTTFFTCCVSIHGRYVWSWWSEFSGVALSCFKCSRSAAFLDVSSLKPKGLFNLFFKATLCSV